MSDGHPDESEVARLTNRTNVVGIDASEYGEDVYQYDGTFSVEYLKQALDIVETLGWDNVNLGSILPDEDDEDHDGRLLLITPDCECPWQGEQASVALAGRANTKYGGNE